MPGKRANGRRAGAAGLELPRPELQSLVLGSPRVRSYWPNGRWCPRPPPACAKWRTGTLGYVLCGEGEDRCRGKGLARLKHGGREVGVVGRVREVLGLERIRLALAVGVAADADQVTVEEVAGVELHARLVGPDGQQPAAARVERARGQVEAGEVRACRVQDPVVVEAVRGRELHAGQGGDAGGAVRDRREDRLQV